MGSNFVRFLYRHLDPDSNIVILDKLTYAGRTENLKDLIDKPRVKLVKGDLCDEGLVDKVFSEEEPNYIVNFAAESHVDRSINEPAPFIRTNILCVFTLLEALRRHSFREYIHVSSDEVYGDLRDGGSADENWPLNPSSPYSASKASGDLLVKAYHRTYGIPVKIVRPCNNYGPYQHVEKLIPKTIVRALHSKPIPIYGDGSQIRDWLYVEDFCEALKTVIDRGATGEVYNIPGFNERRNIDVVRDILRLMNKPEELIRFVDDRPGHDYRYSMRGDKIRSLGWKPRTQWIDGLKKTIEWYISNRWWWEKLVSDKYFVQDTPWS